MRKVNKAMTNSTPYEDIVSAVQALKDAEPNPSNTFTLSPDFSTALRIVVGLLETLDGEMCFVIDGKQYQLKLTMPVKKKGKK